MRRRRQLRSPEKGNGAARLWILQWRREVKLENDLGNQGVTTRHSHNFSRSRSRSLSSLSRLWLAPRVSLASPALA